MNRNLKLTANLLFIISGLAVFSCSKKDKTEVPDDEIVARVGDRIITAQEFKSSYEFSFAPLRTGKNPRRIYLDYLINELLLSCEGFSKGFNKKPYVVNRVKRRKNNNLLESFYIKHVHSKVNIPEEKIQDAIKKSTVKFRLLIWPLPSLKEAQQAFIQASESNLEDYVEKQLINQEVKANEKRFYETDWLDFLDLRPQLLQKLQELEMGKTSEPLSYGDGFALFQVLDINREAIKLDDLKYSKRRKRIEARLHNIEADRIVHELMDSLLTPLDVRVKSHIVDRLVVPLFKWIKEGLPKRMPLVNILKSATDTSRAHILDLKRLLSQTLISTKNGNILVEDYFNYMNYHRKVINQSKSPVDLKNRLLREMGTMIKNNTFIDIAHQEGFLDSANIVQDLIIWEQKWTYDVFRDYVLADIDVSNEEMKIFFKERWRELKIAKVDTTRFYKYENDIFNMILHEKHSALLDQELNKLKEKYPVEINEDVLNSLEISDDKKSLETSLFVVKNFSGEFLVPTADLKWIHY